MSVAASALATMSSSLNLSLAASAVLFFSAVVSPVLFFSAAAAAVFFFSVAAAAVFFFFAAAGIECINLRLYQPVCTGNRNQSGTTDLAGATTVPRRDTQS